MWASSVNNVMQFCAAVFPRVFLEAAVISNTGFRLTLMLRIYVALLRFTICEWFSRKIL